MVPALTSSSNVAVENAEGLSADNMNKLLRQLIDSDSLLAHANFDYLMFQRRLLKGIKPNPEPKVAPLCEADNPSGDNPVKKQCTVGSRPSVRGDLPLRGRS